MDNPVPNPVPALDLRLEVAPAINYALQHNRFPVVQKLALDNRNGQALEHLTLQITTTPAVSLPYSREIAAVPAGAVMDISVGDLQLDSGMLLSLTERLTGSLVAEVLQGETVLCRKQAELITLAFDEWTGFQTSPEFLAAFVQPNHPAVQQLTARVAELLEKWTGLPALDGYQSQDPNRVLSMAGAVYAALQEKNLIYAETMASFEQQGQRIRLPDAVLDHRMGNCLDLSLLYAGCLEAMGLHPLLVIPPGHCFVGVWLEERCFPEAVQDDGSLLAKMTASGIHEAAVVEATALTAGHTLSFDAAQAAARAKLSDPITCFIDVRRARQDGVLPIPQRIFAEGTWHAVRADLPESALTKAPAQLGPIVDVGDGMEAQALTRKQVWERKLLDLGLRNTLINMRVVRTAIPLLAPTLDELEDTLSDGKDLHIFPAPAGWRAGEDANPLETLVVPDTFQQLLREELQNKRLRSTLGDADLTRATKELYRAARSALEENGANALYLALGMLRWYETDRSVRPRYAPLILLPVDLVRKSALQGYVIRLRDEEPQMNITLLEKLSQDFQITMGGLDPLPQDEHGVNVRRVFTIVRKAVMNHKKWDVAESACLGIFSFSQFVMWNDIRNRADDLAQNKVVRSLMENKLCWDAEPMEIGDKVDEGAALLPIPADASQLYAIQAASKGTSFVLHGPPGTGKSQTITALIANTLAQGKTVLFVAEKMAALEVVQKRLADIGLAPFCLELHSSKSRKKDVLEQLRAAVEVVRKTPAEQYAARASQAAALRAELDNYAAALHKVLPIGQSTYTLMGLYQENAGAQDLPTIQPKQALAITAEDYDHQQSLVHQLVAAARQVGHPCGHGLDGITGTAYTQSLRRQLPEVTQQYRQSLQILQQAAAAFGSAIQRPQPQTLSDYGDLSAWATVLLPWCSYPRELAQDAKADARLAQAERAASLYQDAANQRTALEARWSEGFFQQDAAALQQQYRSANGQWFLPKLFAMNKLKKQLQPYAKAGLNKDEIPAALDQLEKYQQTIKDADAVKAPVSLYDTLYTDPQHTDWAAALNLVRTRRADVQKLDQRTGGAAIRAAYGGRPELEAPAKALQEAWQQYLAARDAFAALAGMPGSRAGRPWLPGQLEMLDALDSHPEDLRDWFAWNAAAQEAKDAGLHSVVDAYRTGMRHEDIFPAYLKCVARSVANAAIDADPALNTFSGSVFQDKVRRFNELDQRLTALAQQEIYSRLAANVPDCTREAAQTSEVGILQRAIRSGGRGVSIRRLFEQIPNLLPRLCPCMLMSPLSAAQYLDPKREPFDLVVFDEASQLPTSKAVGAIARGKNAVVVGDPKQMPPTSFFSAGGVVDEDNLDVEDLESILDDCLALNMPQTHLLWHYRSRHESLIAFSNSQFYENKLYTFPSSSERDSRVSLIHVDGLFDRGRSRQNRAEAMAVVDELERRAHDPSLSQESVGVVTFNVNQQALIDDLLNERCAKDQALENWAFHSPEPVFIKNLENVQGDERDVILFSVGYGPDKSGRVSMNFGPLNRDGGWRRLNVAVSRARTRMTVYSTLTPEQLDLSRTKSEGVAALKAFLQYADTGVLPVEERSAGTGETRDGILEAVVQALQANGYQADRRVGHSGFRVDIGVIHPEHPDQYLLGILLDGSGYRTSKTTRDRELAQISVLQGLGWNIRRVRAMDWWDSPQRETKRLLDTLTQLQKNPPHQNPAKKAAAAAPAGTGSGISEAAAKKIAARTQPQPAKTVAAPRPAVQAAVYTATADLPGKKLTAETFLLPENNSAVSRRIKAIVQKEAPILGSLLTKRLLQSCGIARSGARISAHLDQLLAACDLPTTRQGDTLVYWKSGQDPAQYRQYRVPGEGELDKRDAKEIPYQESAAAVCAVLDSMVSLQEEDLVREAGKLLGFSRMGTAVSALIQGGIQLAQADGRIVPGANGKWVLAR